MSKPVTDTEFWKERLDRAIAENEPHKAIWDIDKETWDTVKHIHGEILARLMNPFRSISILDAGCGQGEIIDVLPTNATYIGLDISIDLVRYAQKKYPSHKFVVGDVRKLGYPDHSFDLAICRSMDGMMKDNLGFEAWRQTEREILRVADKLLILGYTDPEIYRLYDASPDPLEFALCTIQEDGSYLSYRPGKDGTIELYDLFVNEKNRRLGVASRLIKGVMSEAYGCLYGFTQLKNEAIHALYQKLGFTLTRIPGFYRGVDAIMVSKCCLNEIGRGKR